MLFVVSSTDRTLLLILVAGLCTPSPPTMACIPGPSLWESPLVERPMWASVHQSRVVELDSLRIRPVVLRS